MKYTRGRWGTTKMGPNHMGHVVWALSDFFFFTNIIVVLEGEANKGQ